MQAEVSLGGTSLVWEDGFIACKALGLPLRVSLEQVNKHVCELGTSLYKGLGVCTCLGQKKKKSVLVEKLGKVSREEGTWKSPQEPGEWSPKPS